MKSGENRDKFSVAPRNRMCYNQIIKYTYKREAFSVKKMILRVLLALLLLVLLAAAGFGVLYAGRLRTVNSIEKITD